MTRKMAYIGLSYMAGLFLSSVFLRNYVYLLAAAAVAAVLFVIVKGKSAFSAVVSCICTAVGIISFAQFREKTDALIEYAVCNEIHFTGTISEYEPALYDKYKYEIKGKADNGLKCGIIVYSPPIDADIGDAVSFDCKAEAFSDSYLFPAEKYYKSRKIFLKANVSQMTVENRRSFSIKRLCVRYSEHIRNVIGSYLSDVQGAMLTAMIFGDKSGLDSNAKTLLNRSGCGHIMAVSGLHLTVISMFVLQIFRWVGLSHKKAVIFSFVPVVLFCVMAGMSASVVRALIMLVILYSAEFFHKEGDVLNSLGITALVLTVPNPFAIYDTGMILSFTGVIGIGVAAPSVTDKLEERFELYKTVLKGWKLRLLKSIITLLCANCIIFPVSLLMFDEVSAISPLSNLLLVPLCSAALVLCAAVVMTGGVPFIAFPLLKLSGALVTPVMWAASFITEHPALIIPTGYGFVRYIAAGTAASAVVLFLYGKEPVRSAMISGAVCLICFGAISLYRIASTGNTRVAYLCSGSDMAVVVHNGRTASVADISGGGFAAAEKYLKSMGIYDIDMVILAKNPASSISDCLYSFSLYNTAGYFCPEGSALGVSGRIEEKLHYYGSEVYDCGYCIISADASGNIIISAEDILFCGAVSKEVNVKDCFCTMTGSGKYDIIGSRTVLSGGKAECNAPDSEVFYNCCMEYKITENNVRRRVIFDGNS